MPLGQYSNIGSAAEAPFDGHGWAVNRKAIHVGDLPGRKQTCLYVVDGSVIRTLAFFKTREKAQEALDMLDGLVRGQERAS